MIRQRVLDKAEHNGLALSGSILGLRTEYALTMCDALVAHGSRIHIDVIDQTYPRRIGVVDEVIQRIPEPLWDAVELHLMVGPDRPLNYPRFGRVIAHLRDPRDPGLAERLPAAGERWISIEPQDWGPPDVQAVVETVRPSGVLIMLTPPAAAPASADLDRLLLPSAVEARSLLPTGVDGGARPEHFARLAELGVSSVVVGRALFRTNAGADGVQEGGTSQ